jgi:hypothetical protein
MADEVKYGETDEGFYVQVGDVREWRWKAGHGPGAEPETEPEPKAAPKPKAKPKK